MLYGRYTGSYWRRISAVCPSLLHNVIRLPTKKEKEKEKEKEKMFDGSFNYQETCTVQYSFAVNSNTKM
ncbi:uncharacterized protein M6B38_389630 [Iris pallida]|uniref:Uncharacterized protein n=1 Tax=Iris pallida TaxID=29817 RepID=A0AAX6G104_IRIPA|nr:uncharacterized protein M6B38_389630 [Iris pallida]